MPWSSLKVPLKWLQLMNAPGPPSLTSQGTEGVLFFPHPPPSAIPLPRKGVILEKHN